MGVMASVSFFACVWCLLHSVRSQVVDVSGNGITCNFEGTLCDWEQSTKDNLQWNLQNGYTPTRRAGKILTGPQYDHTSHQGFYVYMETSQANTGNYADLVTKNAISEQSNLEIWYCMYGLSMGSLEVLVWPLGDVYPGPSAKPECSVRGSKMDGWVKQTVRIRYTITPYKIIIRAVTGGRGTSDIAIDDVTLSSATSGLSRSGNMITTLTPPPAPVIVSSTVLYKCDFDYGNICNWAHPQNTIMKWLVRTDGTPTPNTGANKDHTSGKGRFMYIETTSSSSANLQPGTEARVLSPVVLAASSCPVYMTLYYNMYGKDIGTLQIMIYQILKTRQLVWNKHGQQHADGDTWTRAEFQLPGFVIGKQFQLEIVATRGNGPYGDICIDDVSVNQVCDSSTFASVPTSKRNTLTLSTKIISTINTISTTSFKKTPTATTTKPSTYTPPTASSSSSTSSLLPLTLSKTTQTATTSTVIHSPRNHIIDSAPTTGIPSTPGHTTSSTTAIPDNSTNYATASSTGGIDSTHTHKTKK